MALAAIVVTVLLPSAPAVAAAPTFSSTLVGPSEAEMYSSGLEWDAGNNRIVMADTGLDRISFYDLAGNKQGQFGASGAATGQFSSPRDVAIDDSGNIYVADAGNNRIAKYDAAGTLQWTAGGVGPCNSCLNTPIGVTWDAANNVVLVASTGQSLVKAYDAGGAFVWKSPAGSTTGLVAPRDAIRGPDGRIWVSAYKPGATGTPTGHQIKAYDVTPSGVWTTPPAIVLGDGAAAGKGAGQLNFPYNAEFSPDGTVVYVSDTGNDRIARWDLTTSPPTWMAPIGARCLDPCPDDSPGLFEHLRRVAVTEDGTVIGADFWGNALQLFDPDGTVIRQIAGAAAPAPGVAQAFGVAVAGDGTTYVVDRLNQRLERFDPAGSYLNKTGSRGIGAGRFSWPEAVAVAPDGAVWVADTRNDRLERFTADLSGTPAVVGSFGSAVGKFNYPEDLDVAPDGKVWVADTRNHRLQSYDPASATFAAFGSLGSGAGQLSGPQGVAVSSSAIFVADTGNDRIQKLGLDGSFLAQFTGLSGPEGVAVAPDGSVWVADTGNARILHLSADLADLGDTFGSLGSGSLQFDRPHSLAVSGSRLLVADTYNSRVQVFTIQDDPPPPPPPPPFSPAFQRHQADPGGVAPLYPAGGATDAAGNRYVADSGGNRIVKIDAGGAQTTVPATGWNDPRDLDFDTDGTLWVVDTSDSQVVHLATNGTVLATFGGPTTLKTPYGLANDATGVYVADTYNNRVVKLDKSNGSQQWVQSTCSGKAFSRPRDVGVGSDGNIYVADTDNGRISVLNPAGACQTSFGTKGAGNGQYKSPRSLISDGAGGLWIADALNHRVQHVTNTGAFIAKTSSSFGEGTGQYRSPHCVFLDQGQLDVCDTFNYRIQRYTIADGVPTFASILGGVRPTAGGFNGAFDATYGPAGELYAVDWFNHRIQKFKADGTFDLQWGGYGAANGSLIFPRGVAVAADGNVVVTDSENNRIDIFTPTGGFVRSVKPATGTAFLRPHQTAPLADGTFWVADTNNNRVIHLDSTGAVLTSFNNGGLLKSPRGIAADSAGNVYVANYTTSRIEKYSATGTLLATLATFGSGSSQVKKPHGLRLTGAAGSERLWIADSGNNRILVLGTDGSAIGSFGSTGSGSGQFNTPKGVAVNPTTGAVSVADFANNRLSFWTT